MSAVSTTTWTCDFCLTAQVVNHELLPVLMYNVVLTVIGHGVDADNDNIAGLTLCGPCVETMVKNSANAGGMS
jgi:hypothetical protein